MKLFAWLVVCGLVFIGMSLAVWAQVKGGLATQRVTRVVDGDTVVLNRGGKLVTCRLIGVSAPETHHPSRAPEPYGKEAEEYLRSWLEGKTVRVDYEYPADSPYRYDRYRRLLVYLWADRGRQLVNLELVKRGCGRFQGDYRTRYRVQFKAAEAEAKGFGMGLWGVP